MHHYTWFMFLGLTVAGGIIAFMGDRLGRFMGKRRMTICGLRPRHTALFSTVVAGMLISVTSLVAMTLLSAHVRLAVFEVHNLQRERNQLRRERTNLESQNHRLVAESKRLRSDYEASKERAIRAAAEEKRSRQQLAVTLRRLAEVRAQAERRVAVLQREVAKRSRMAAEKSSQITGLARRIHAVQKELDGALARLSDARQRHRETAARYRDAEARLADVSARHRDVSDRLSRAQTDLDTTRADLDRLRGEVKSLTEQVQASREQIHSLEAAKAGLEASRDDLQREVASLSDQRDQLARAAAEADRRNQALRESYDEQRLRAIALNLGEELAWEVVDGREPRARIRSRLETLVDRARSVAVQQGAGVPAKPETALTVVRIVSPADEGQRRAERVLFNTDALDTVTEEISRANTGVVAQIRAATNTVVGEPALAEIQLWQNRLVFHQGEVIARKEMNNRKTTGEIVQDLVAMLQNDVRSAAVFRGMVPRGSAVGGAQASPVGEVPLADLVAAAEQIRKQHGGAVVEAVSPSDLWTADTMRIRFRIGPRPAVPPVRMGGALSAVQ